jgi:hypothetical protein
MTAYDPDTYHPDTFDPDAFPEGTTFSMRTVAKLLNDPSGFPVLDDPRTVANAELGREVIDELGAIVPYTPRNDYWTRMDVRLAYDQDGGIYLEVGPFDLDETDIAVLKAAIAAWERIAN